MNKLFVALLSIMFAFAPVATAISEEKPVDSVESNEVVETIGETAAEVVDNAVTEEVTEEVAAETVEETAVEEKVETIKTDSAVIIDDRFGGGNYINMTNKEFENSLFFAGNTIIDESTAKTGLGFFAGRDLLLSGNYEYGIHAADTMVVEGSYERDLFAIGNRILITSNAKIARDVFIAANEINILSDLHGDVFIAANKLSFRDVKIEGNLRVVAKEVQFSGETAISGEFLYNDDIVITGEANASKESTYHVPVSDFKISNMMIMFFQLGGSIIFLLTFMFIARNFFKELRNDAETIDSNEVVVIFFGGVCSAIILPIVAAVLMLTIIGIPAGLILLLAWVVLLAISSVTTAFYIASKFMPNMNSIVGSILVLILFAVVSLVPYLNLVARVAAICFGFGLIFRALFSEKKA